MRNSLCAEKSSVNRRGPTRALRPALPNAPATFGVNADAFHQCAGIGSSTYGDTPVVLGRSKPAPVPERSVPPTVGVTGKPLCTVQIPPTCQPPTKALASGFDTF